MNKRFECHRERTGRIRVDTYLFGWIKVVREEWSVLTNLLSHDITDEWHTEWCIKKH